MTEIRIENLEDIDRAAREFVRAIGPKRHIAFHAPMGAGKTTFIAAICRTLGSEDESSSPTFSLVNEYVVDDANATLPADLAGKPIYHFDFYRIETPEEALDMGLDDYWESGALCLMEWPENVEAFLPEDTVDVDIAEQEDGSRLVRF